MSSKLKLGDYVVDSVSGFEGTVTSETRFLNGCRRLGVQPKINKDGKLPDAVSFDEQQLQIMKKEAVKNTPTKTGGPVMKAERE